MRYNRSFLGETATGVGSLMNADVFPEEWVAHVLCPTKNRGAEARDGPSLPL